MRSRHSLGTLAAALALLGAACNGGSSNPSPSSGGKPSTGGNSGGGGTAATGGTITSTGGGVVVTGGKSATGGATATGGTTSPNSFCTTSTANVVPCGGDLSGTWTVTPSCLKVSGQYDMADFGIGCKFATITGGGLDVKGTFTAAADGKFTDGTTTTGTVLFTLDKTCLEVSGTTTNCDSVSGSLSSLGFESTVCNANAAKGCDCVGTVNQKGSIGSPSSDPLASGKLTTASNEFTSPDSKVYSYCVAGNKLTMTPKTTSPTVTGSIVLQKGGTPTGGVTSTGGNTGGVVTATGGTSAGGNAATGGSAGRDAGTSDTSTSTGGGTPATGGNGGGSLTERPCDIYAAANTPCVAAYSMVRSLSKSYTGPLYQVRSGSSATNMGTGGSVKDIGQTADGFADTATQDTFCTGTTCTVSKLYDHSGNGNAIGRAPAGKAGNGDRSGNDCYESSATKGAVTVGGHKVYSLYLDKFEGYRVAVGVNGKNMPVGKVPQGIYELVDGTRFGTACCWDFGNVTNDPTKYADMNTLFFGQAYWGKGNGSAPWFMVDFEAGVWAGGSKIGDPGWGGLNDAHPVNTANPSMKGVAFAMGLHKSDASKWTLRMADLQTATDLATAYDGALPKSISNSGGIVLGVGGDNSNNSWGTFYEGAIVSGFPTAATDLAIMKNLKAAGYTK